MSFVRQSIRTQPPFGELGDPPFAEPGHVLYEEEYLPAPITMPNNQVANYSIPATNSNNQETYYSAPIAKSNDHEESFIQTDDRRLLKKRSREELIHADYIERLMIEASQRKNRRRRSSALSSDISSHEDSIQQADNDDWFFEKLLERSENIRSRKSDRYLRSSSSNLNNNVPHGVERIIERRYYVKKTPLAAKRNQPTSTSDLREYGRKSRQSSGTSSERTTSACSQCSSTPPSYVENLRHQSDTLRNDIGELKGEIEQLQTSQQEFFQQLRTQFRPKTGSPIGSQISNRPINLPIRSPIGENTAFGSKIIPLTTGQRSRSVSTQSLASTSETLSEASASTVQPTKKPVATPSNAPVAPKPLIADFMATKNPSVAPSPPFDDDASSTASSVASTPSVNNARSPSIATTSSANVNSKPPPVAPTLPTNFNLKPPAISPVNLSKNSKPPSIAQTSSLHNYVNVKSPSVAPTPPANLNLQRPPIAPSLPANFNSKPPSVTQTSSLHNYVNVKPPPVAPPLPASFSLNPPPAAPAPPANFNTKPAPVAPPLPASFNLNPSPAAPAPPANFNTKPPPAAPAMPGNFNTKPPSVHNYVNVKSPLGASTLLANVNSKPESIASTPLVHNYVNTKSTPASLANSLVNSKPPSVHSYGTSKSSSLASTPLIGDAGRTKNPFITSAPSARLGAGPIGSRNSSVAPTPTVAPSSMSSARIPTFENQLAHRRALSPSSEIVAASASFQGSSNASSRSTTPQFSQSNLQNNPKTRETPLHGNDLQNLIQYSAHLRVSGYPPGVTPGIHNVNTDNNFRNSLHEFIQNSQPRNKITGLAPISRSNNTNTFGLYNSTTKQLDKYDLEIKPQEFITSSAPLLMPPLDISP